MTKPGLGLEVLSRPSKTKVTPTNLSPL